MTDPTPAESPITETFRSGVILAAASALSATLHGKVAAAEHYLGALSKRELQQVGTAADRLSMIAFALAGPTEDDPARLTVPTAPVPAAPPTVDFDLDELS